MDEIKEDFWHMPALFMTGFLTAGTAGAGDGVVVPPLMKLKPEPLVAVG